MSQRSYRGNKDLAALDEMIEEITVDAYGDDEKLWAFRQAFDDKVKLPADGFVIGEPVSVIEVDYDGNERRGLTARCRREDGSEHVVAVSEVVFPQASAGARHVAAYSKWLNLDPFPAEGPIPARRKRQHKATAGDLDLSKPVELVALSVKERAARCRLLGSDRVITLRASRLWEVVPGEIVKVKPRKQWRYSGHPYLSGELQSTRLDVAALDLVPLGLEDMGMWDPKEHYWGEEDGPIEEWAKPIMAHGPRPAFGMEQVLPGENPDDPFDDPITQSNDLKDAGELAEAEKILMEMCQTDLRCLDAHSHLGNLVYDHRPEDAIRHYEVGLRIGELSLGNDFNDVLHWGYIDNRPFLRCMHGYGLCLWRLGRFDEAECILDRMLWLSPSDNLGVRFIIDEVRTKTAWEERENELQPNDTTREAPMDLKLLKETPPWDWPEAAGKMLLEILANDRADASDRILAAELAGNFTVVNDNLVDVLLSILQSSIEPEELRGTATISLGPVLEIAGTDGFEDPDDVPISEGTFHRIQESLRRLYVDAAVPKDVRRQIMEVSVRAPQAWHQDAIRAAYSGDDEDWKLTAVFSMRWVCGFNDQILEALESDNQDIHYQAICAAGNWELDAAWSHISGLVSTKETDKLLLLAAIDAVAGIRPQEAGVVLVDLTDSEDEDIVEAAYEAMAMAEEPSGDDFDDEDDDEFVN